MTCRIVKKIFHIYPCIRHVQFSNVSRHVGCLRTPTSKINFEAIGVVIYEKSTLQVFRIGVQNKYFQYKANYNIEKEVR